MFATNVPFCLKNGQVTPKKKTLAMLKARIKLTVDISLLRQINSLDKATSAIHYKTTKQNINNLKLLTFVLTLLYEMCNEDFILWS